MDAAELERASTSSASPPVEMWTTRALFARHKALGVGAVALLVLLLAIIAGGILASSPMAVSDSSTCSAWSSANASQQSAYAVRYVKAHGALPSGASGSGSVVAAINTGCIDAFDNDTQDKVTIVTAIKQQ